MAPTKHPQYNDNSDYTPSSGGMKGFVTEQKQQLSDTLVGPLEFKDYIQKTCEKDIDKLRVPKTDEYLLPSGMEDVEALDIMKSLDESLRFLGTSFKPFSWVVQSSTAMFLQSPTYNKIPGDIDVSIAQEQFFVAFATLRQQDKHLVDLHIKHIKEKGSDDKQKILTPSEEFMQQLSVHSQGKINQKQFLENIKHTDSEICKAYEDGAIKIDFYTKTENGIGYNVELFPEGKGNGMVQPIVERDSDGNICSSCYDGCFAPKYIAGIPVPVMTPEMLKHFYCMNLIYEIGGDTVDSDDDKLKGADRLNNILFHLKKVGVTPDNLVEEIDATVQQFISAGGGRSKIKGYIKNAVKRWYGDDYVSPEKRSPRLVITDRMKKHNPEVSNQKVIDTFSIFLRSEIQKIQSDTDISLGKKKELVESLDMQILMLKDLQQSLSKQGVSDEFFVSLDARTIPARLRSIFLRAARFFLDQKLDKQKKKELNEDFAKSIDVHFIGNGDSIDKESVYDMMDTILKHADEKHTTYKDLYEDKKNAKEFKTIIPRYKSLLRSIFKEIDGATVEDFEEAPSGGTLFTETAENNAKEVIKTLYKSRKNVDSFLDGMGQELSTVAKKNLSFKEKIITKTIFLQQCLKAYKKFLKDQGMLNFVTALEIQKIHRYYVDRIINFLILKPERLSKKTKKSS